MLINTTLGERAPAVTDTATGADLPSKPSRPHSIFRYINKVYAAGNPQPDLAEEYAA